jgi:hypothetical protein
MRWFALAALAIGFAAPLPLYAQDDSESGKDSGSSEGSESADSGDASEQEEGDEAQDDSYRHGGQFFVRAGLLFGYRVNFRYDSSPFCADPTEDVPGEERQLCGYTAPLALDLGLGFAPMDGVEPFAWGRFGFVHEKDTDTKPLVAFGGGARIYTMSDSAFKVFIEPAFGIEIEKGGDDPVWQRADAEYGTDLLFHLAAGPQYDFAKNVGVYLDAGLTVGILRAINTTMELQLGVQSRFP